METDGRSANPARGVGGTAGLYAVAIFRQLIKVNYDLIYSELWHGHKRRPRKARSHDDILYTFRHICVTCIMHAASLVIARVVLIAYGVVIGKCIVSCMCPVYF